MLFKNLYDNSGNQKSISLYESVENPQNVKMYESFSGGLFRGKAGNTINKLKIYYLLRGLEIETEADSYTKLAKAIPSCANVFVESEAENVSSSRIITYQIKYIQTQINSIEQKYKSVFDFVNANITGKGADADSLDSKLYKEIEPLILQAKEGGVAFGKIKGIIKAVHGEKTMDTFFSELIKNIEADDSGLEAEVFNKIDDLDLEEIESKDFAPMPKNYVAEPINSDDLVSSNNPIQRISGLIEKAMGIMKLEGISYVTGEDSFKFLSSIIVPMSKASGVAIGPSELKDYEDLIKKIGEKILKPELETFVSNHSKNITVPSLQSLYFGLVSSMILKLINYNVKSIEGKEEAAKKSEEATKKDVSKVKTVSTNVEKPYSALNDTNFFKSDRIFYSTPKRKYTEEEYQIIKSIKEVFVSIGMIDDKSKEYLERKVFGEKLTDAVKEFQTLVGLNSDGKIGKNTKLTLKAFLESLKQNAKPTEKKQ